MDRVEGDAGLRVVAAVVTQALRDATARKASRNHHGASCVTHSEKEQARNWLQSDEHVPWSFQWCCELLGLDDAEIEAVRERIKEGAPPIPRLAPPRTRRPED